MICLFPRPAIQHHSNPSLYTPTTNAKEAKVDEFYEALEDLLRLTPKKKKKYSMHHWGLECKGRKSRYTGLGEQNEARQRLTEFCQKNALVIANTLSQQHKT